MRVILTRKVLDPVNSASWFLMDVSWAAHFQPVAYSFMGLTALTGAALLPVDRHRGHLWVNAALNCWIWLNLLWMVADLRGIDSLRLLGLGVAGVGILLIAIGAFCSHDLQRTLAHFSRLRFLDRSDEP